MQDIIIILALIAVITYQQFVHSKERKDLYNRIMSRDLTEYKQVTQDKQTPKNSPMQIKLEGYKKQWKQKGG